MQVVAPVAARVNQRHELLLAGIVVALRWGQLPGAVGDGLQSRAVVLLQCGPDRVVARVAVEHEGLGGVGQ